MRNYWVVTAILLLAGSFCRPAHAADRFFTGSLSVETPVGQSPNRESENSPTVLGDLKLHNVMPHLNLFAAGQLQWKAGTPFSNENKARVGLEYELFNGISVYTYGERRFDLNSDRYMVGVQYHFHSPKF